MVLRVGRGKEGEDDNGGEEEGGWRAVLVLGWMTTVSEDNSQAACVSERCVQLLPTHDYHKLAQRARVLERVLFWPQMAGQ